MIKPTAISALLIALTAPAGADTTDDADITFHSYEVSGETLSEIQDAMGRDGPRGFWAYTTWNVTWTADCQTTVTSDITLPELDPDADLTDDDIAEFNRMAEALLAHELQHVDFGIAFAADVADQGCPANSDDILQPYLEAERTFDAETEHGFLQGVSLNTEE